MLRFDGDDVLVSCQLTLKVRLLDFSRLIVRRSAELKTIQSITGMARREFTPLQRRNKPLEVRWAREEGKQAIRISESALARIDPQSEPVFVIVEREGEVEPAPVAIPAPVIKANGAPAAAPEPSKKPAPPTPVAIKAEIPDDSACAAVLSVRVTP